MAQNKIVRRLNRELRQEYLDKGITPTHKYCSMCNELKLLEDFCKSKDGTKLFDVEAKCKICNRKRNKEFMEIPENKEHRDKYSREYHELNKEIINPKRKEYKKNNKEKVKEQNKKSNQKNKKKRNVALKYKTDTNEDFRTKRLLRTRLGNVMRGQKSMTCGEYGIDWNACVTHLGPRPDNINVHHCDHIIPCNCFDFTNDSHPALCFHPTNLRWDLADENLKKNDTIYPELIDQYNLWWIIEALNLNIDEWNATVAKSNKRKNK